MAPPKPKAKRINTAPPAPPPKPTPPGPKPPPDLPPDWQGHPDGRPRVVKAALGLTASAALGSSGRTQRSLSTQIQEAMVAAAQQALAEGLTWKEAETIRSRMLAARQRVLDEGGER